MITEFPKRIELELVSACNLGCVYCPRHYLDELNGYIDFNLFERLIKEMTPYPDTVLVLHRRGESLLHPRFVEMCEMVKGKFKEVQIATNATVLSEEKAIAVIDSLDFISFSLDTPDRYNKIRVPAKYDAVIKKINQFLDLNKNRVKTQVSMVRTEDVDDTEVEQFTKIWEGQVDRVRVYQEHSSDKNFGSIKGGRSPRLPCVMPEYEMLIYCDGKTGRCNHDWDGPPTGDVNKNTIKEIWGNEFYTNLRKQHQILQITDPVCSKCDSWYPEIGKQGTGKTFDDSAIK